MSSASAALHRLPIEISERLLGRADLDSIVSAIRRFTDSYDDTSDFTSQVPWLTKVILECSSRVLTPSERRRFEMTMDGLAFEANGASVEWYANTNRPSDAEVFIWVSRLCCCKSFEGCGFSASVFGLSRYVVLGPRRKDVLDCFLAMCPELLERMSWQYALETLQLYVCVATVTQRLSEVWDCIARETSRRADLQDLRLALDPGWSAPKGVVSKLDVDNIKFLVSNCLLGSTDPRIHRDMAEIESNLVRLLTELARRAASTGERRNGGD